MVKILSKSGDSLADTYDVQGSIAGIEQLVSQDVSLVHEMGNTIFSERVSTTIRRAESGDVLQSASFNIVLVDLPAVPFRILSIACFVDTAARLDQASVALNDPDAEREIPIWLWDSVVDTEVSARFQQDGGAVGTETFLRPLQPIGAIPCFTSGRGQPQKVPRVAFRGSTLAFGAGTVETTMLFLIGFSQIGGISSRGLPIPSW